MTTFPTALDSFQNPAANTLEDATGLEHDVQHANANDAIAALQAKLGVNGSTDVNSVDYKLAQLLAAVLNPDANFRIASGQFQIWDDGLETYLPLTCNNGVLGVQVP